MTVPAGIVLLRCDGIAHNNGRVMLGSGERKTPWIHVSIVKLYLSGVEKKKPRAPHVFFLCRCHGNTTSASGAVWCCVWTRVKTKVWTHTHAHRTSEKWHSVSFYVLVQRAEWMKTPLVLKNYWTLNERWPLLHCSLVAAYLTSFSPVWIRHFRPQTWQVCWNHSSVFICVACITTLLSAAAKITDNTFLLHVFQLTS